MGGLLAAITPGGKFENRNETRRGNETMDFLNLLWQLWLIGLTGEVWYLTVWTVATVLFPACLIVIQILEWIERKALSRK
jgi:hypothetical protein